MTKQRDVEADGPRFWKIFAADETNITDATEEHAIRIIKALNNADTTEVDADSVQIDIEEAIAGVLMDSDLIYGQDGSEIEDNAASGGRRAFKTMIDNVTVAEYAALRHAFGKEN